MGLRLLLLRHAKSDWPTGAPIDDHERALNVRGRRAAPLVGMYIQEKGYVPDLVLCSTARRTRETCDLILPAFARPPVVSYRRRLYLAEWPVLLAVVRKSGEGPRTLLVIGHNPGLGQLALALAREPPDAAERERKDRLREKFPTGALAVFDFDAVEWRAVETGQGRLVDYVRPKGLAAAGEHGE